MLSGLVCAWAWEWEYECMGTSTKTSTSTNRSASVSERVSEWVRVRVYVSVYVYACVYICISSFTSSPSYFLHKKTATYKTAAKGRHKDSTPFKERKIKTCESLTLLRVAVMQSKERSFLSFLLSFLSFWTTWESLTEERLKKGGGGIRVTPRYIYNAVIQKCFLKENKRKKIVIT